MRSRLSQVGVLAAMLLGLAGSMSGSGEAAPAQERLGTVHFPVSCGADVQPDFDRAVALLHHMTYPQARAAFEAIGRRDPACAMAQWGSR